MLKLVSSTFVQLFDVPCNMGRIDDILVLSSGEKTVTTPIESSIAASPYVNGTAMFGRGRNRNHVGIGIL